MSRPDELAGFSGEALKDLIKICKKENKGIKSNADICKALGLNRIGTLSDWANNKQIPSEENLNKLAHFFDVPVSFFYKGTTTDVQKAILEERDNIRETVFEEQRKEATLYSLFEEDYLSLENPDATHLVAYLRSCGYEVDYLAKIAGFKSDKTENRRKHKKS